MQAHLNDKSQTGDRHVHVNFRLDYNITSKTFPPIDTHHNTNCEGLTIAVHYIEDRGFTLLSSHNDATRELPSPLDNDNNNDKNHSLINYNIHFVERKLTFSNLIATCKLALSLMRDPYFVLLCHTLFHP